VYGDAVPFFWFFFLFLTTSEYKVGYYAYWCCVSHELSLLAPSVSYVEFQICLDPVVFEHLRAESVPQDLSVAGSALVRPKSAYKPNLSAMKHCRIRMARRGKMEHFSWGST
jgi:hypothetical protein